MFNSVPLYFDYALFQLKCSGIELIVGAFFGYQLIVAAALDYAAVVKDHYDIGVLHG